MTLLDRYVLKKFFVPFLYCFLGLIAIWFVFDLTDNGPDFIQGHASLKKIAEFYSTQLPEIMCICLPISNLLALIYMLTQMARCNEMVAMLTAGRSLIRCLLPLFCVGVVFSGALTVLNYASVPHAASVRKTLLREIKRGEKRSVEIKALLFRNSQDQRTWFMRRLDPQQGQMWDFQMIQQKPDGSIAVQYYGQFGRYQPSNHTWHFSGVKILEVNAQGDIISNKSYNEVFVSQWSETPWRMASSTFNADFLSVPELRDYLQYNSDFSSAKLAPFRTNLAYRWSLPWVCLIVVFLAAPVGAMSSRQQIFQTIAITIGLFFTLVFLNSLFVALGKGEHLPAWVAAWGPLLGFLVGGLGWLKWYSSQAR